MPIPKHLPVSPATLASILLRFNEPTREIAFGELTQDLGPEAVANLRALLPELAKQKHQAFEAWLDEMERTPGIHISGPWRRTRG